jgi:hypothetical protein
MSIGFRQGRKPCVRLRVDEREQVIFHGLAQVLKDAPQLSGKMLPFADARRTTTIDCGVILEEHELTGFNPQLQAISGGMSYPVRVCGWTVA